MKGWRVEVIDSDTEKTTHTVACKNERKAERVDDAMQHNLDHERFYTLVKGPEEE